MANVDPKDAQRLKQLLSSLHLVESLEDFMNRVSPQYPPPAHVKPIIELFERSRHEPVRAVISMPPGHAKSHTALHGLAWLMKTDPALKCAYLSNGAKLAVEHSRKIRDLSVEGGLQLRKDSKAVDSWHTTNGGVMYAMGVGGPLTGRRISGLCVADDLIKGPEDANSLSQRDKVWEWMSSVLTTRLLPGASVIVIGTRWHMDDAIGRLKEKNGRVKWEVIDMPAVHDGDGNPIDEREQPDVARALWPSMYDMDALKDARDSVTEYTWSALYQGRPVPVGSAVFDPNPCRFYLNGFKMDGHRIVIAVDPAATASSKSDHSVALVCAMKGFGNSSQMWFLDNMRAQVTIPDLVRRLLKLQTKWKCPLAVEAVSGFKAVPQMLKEANPFLEIKKVELKGDKFTRAQPYAAAWNSGRVHVPIDAPWAEKFIKEHSIFTGIGDLMDDQVDAGAHGYTALYRANPYSRGVMRNNFLPFG